MLAKSSLSVLLLLMLTSRGSAQGIDSGCCNLQKCKKLPTLPLTLEEFVGSSPFYAALSSSPHSSELSSTCDTYFKLTKNTYVLFSTALLMDGTLFVQKIIISDLPGQTGVYRSQGQYGDSGNETTIFNTYIVSAACSSCQPMYLAYVCYLFNSCEYINYGYDTVIGLSSSVENAPSCLDRFEEMVSGSGLRVEGFTRTTSAPTCVVYFNNATCINADRVDPANAISYPKDCGY